MVGLIPVLDGGNALGTGSGGEQVLSEESSSSRSHVPGDGQGPGWGRMRGVHLIKN